MIKFWQKLKKLFLPKKSIREHYYRSDALLNHYRIKLAKHKEDLAQYTREYLANKIAPDFNETPVDYEEPYDNRDPREIEELAFTHAVHTIVENFNATPSIELVLFYHEQKQKEFDKVKLHELNKKYRGNKK